jgi:eukaryotic-like serine/threonine-protein kinase
MAVRFETDSEPIPGYRLIDRLGAGGFGEVWKCTAPGDIFKAVKIVHGDMRSKDTDLVRYAEQELKALKRVKSVRHPYLLSIDRYDIVEGRLLIVMELADCNLWDRFRECRQKGLPGIPREELLTYMSESAEVLDLFNDHYQLQHLDIKPQNLFMLHNHVKVADFGQVKDLEGHMASVTGGITPVYAAPETFDGFVSRYCDQYSLACVYQELLTGIRPFDGASMQQLLMQHLQMPPNLTPCPPADRTALARALAKKPEDRFPNVASLVKALRHGPETPTPVATVANSASNAGGLSGAISAAAFASPSASGGSSLLLPIDVPTTDTPLPLAVLDTQPPRPTPPEQTGPGSVRPALVIGLGQCGLRVLQRLRRQVADRVGAAERLPSLRYLFVDTDSETLEQATQDKPREGGMALRQDEIFAAKLNRAGQYLKPRLNGRTLIEGWFDSQLLYKLPRNPVTTGLRILGRLAFCDHYRNLMSRVQAELDAAIDPMNLDATAAALGGELRTNRPRVYIVAGLAGGTGSGMVLDAAYACRQKLRRMGYDGAEVVGVLLTPPDAATDEVGQHAQANAYAALTEIYHYTLPKNTFYANYDDRHGTLRDPGPPFAQMVVLSGPSSPAVPLTPVGTGAPAGRVAFGGRSGNYKAVTGSGPNRSVPGSGAHRALKPGSGPHAAFAPTSTDLTPAGHDPFTQAADFLRLELTTPLGRGLEERRPPEPAGLGAVTVRTFGLAKFDWPRGEVIARTSKILYGVVLDHWVSPNFSRARGQIPIWISDVSRRLNIDADGLLARLKSACDERFGSSIEAYFADAAEKLAPKGWMARLPDPNAIGTFLSHLDPLVGSPAAGKAAGSCEDVARECGFFLAETAQNELVTQLLGLADHADYRLAGAEEATRQLLATLERSTAAAHAKADQAEGIARNTYERLVACMHKGMRKPPAAEVAEALRGYPKAQLASILHRRAGRVYEHLTTVAQPILQEINTCRSRLEAFHGQMIADLEQPSLPIGPRQVMPVGCPTIEDAAQKFLGVLTDEDLADLERRIQAAVEEDSGGLYQACLNTAGGSQRVLQILREQTRQYLNERLGEVDLAGMLAQTFGGPAGVGMTVARAYKDAQPELIGNGPWSKANIAVLACPPGAGGQPLRDAAARSIPTDTPVNVAETRDELVLYREYPFVPLAALAQLGPAWANAYSTAQEHMQCTPHTRSDVPAWSSVDAD